MHIIVDVGGTNIRVAASKDLRRISAIRKFRNPGDWRKALSGIAETARALADGERIRGAIVGVPGPVDRVRGTVLRAPHLGSWAGKPLARTLSGLLRAPVRIENDTVLGAAGEAHFGAGKGKRIVAFLAIGTGLGGARVEDGEVSLRSVGFEPGHQILDPKGAKWSYCGQRGCFESYASGTAFRKRFGTRMSECRSVRVWKAWSERFAQGLVNVIVLWSPDVVVIGGGPGSAAAARFLPFVRAKTRASLKLVKTPPIMKAALGDDAGLYGGMRLLREAARRR